MNIFRALQFKKDQLTAVVGNQIQNSWKLTVAYKNHVKAWFFYVFNF